MNILFIKSGVKLPVCVYLIHGFRIFGDPEIAGYVAQESAEVLKEVLKEVMK